MRWVGKELGVHEKQKEDEQVWNLEVQRSEIRKAGGGEMFPSLVKPARTSGFGLSG